MHRCFASSTARDLARLLLGWLAAIVFVQALAAAQGVVQGPLHRHVPAQRTGPSFASLAFAHAEAEGHVHVGWARHLHVGADAATAVVQDDEQSLGATAAAALAAMAAVLIGIGAFTPDRRRHVMRASPGWNLACACLLPPERPPRSLAM
jgi:hypothetical protein